PGHKVCQHIELAIAVEVDDRGLCPDVPDLQGTRGFKGPVPAAVDHVGKSSRRHDEIHVGVSVEVPARDGAWALGTGDPKAVPPTLPVVPRNQKAVPTHVRGGDVLEAVLVEVKDFEPVTGPRVNPRPREIETSVWTA